MPPGSYQNPGMGFRSSIAEAVAAAAAEAARSDAYKGRRAPRCTGSAIAMATSLLEACSLDAGARAVVFSGGPAVGGSGEVVSADLAVPLRAHHDLQSKADASRLKKVTKHYTCLADRCCAGGFAIDLVCASLEQTGLWEMRSCVQRSGGHVLQAETFGAPHLRTSIGRLLALDENQELDLGYGATIEVRTSRECESIQLLSPGASAGGSGGGQVVDSSEVGDARSFSWPAGAISSHTCPSFVMKRSTEDLPGPRGTHYIQLSTSYRHASGGRRCRITTLRLPRATRPVSMREMLPAFDQQAAAALLVRLACHQAEQGSQVRRVGSEPNQI
jgi:protein transport protein SEC23